MLLALRMKEGDLERRNVDGLWEREENGRMGSPQEPEEKQNKTQPCSHLDFSPLDPMSADV